MRQFLSRSMGVLVCGMVACVSEPPTSSELSPDVSPHRRKIPLTADWSVAMSIELTRPGASANFNTAALQGWWQRGNAPVALTYGLGLG